MSNADAIPGNPPLGAQSSTMGRKAVILGDKITSWGKTPDPLLRRGTRTTTVSTSTKAPRAANTYRSNKVNPKRYARFQKMAWCGDFLREMLQPAKSVAAGGRSLPKSVRHRGCTTDRNGRPHKHLGEIARRLKQVARRVPA